MTNKTRRILTGILGGLAIFIVANYYAGSRLIDHSKEWERDCKEAADSLAGNPSPYDRFSILTKAEIPTFECGKRELAKSYAIEVLAKAPDFQRYWNYGNAIHKSHIVLGRYYLAKGDVDSACQELLLAGRTPGSPQLDSFGPNMSLARELLTMGRRETVLQYFDECKVFWRSDFGALTKWRIMIRLHLMPDFGANLLF